MLFTKDSLYDLQNQMFNNNIDKEDVIRFVTTYSLQDKVPVNESKIISDFCKQLINI